MIPKDPVMLLSYVNTQLRDYYDSLDDFLKDKELSGEGLIKKLASMITNTMWQRCTTYPKDAGSNLQKCVVLWNY